MKKTLLSFVFVAIVATISAQTAKVSPRAAMLLREVQGGKYSVVDLDSRYHFVKSNGTSCVQAFATLADGTDVKALDRYGVRVGSQTGARTMVLIPVERYAAFVASGLCSHVDLGYELKPHLDKARADLGVDFIHNGINLPQGYDGTGVVVGVIDIGFEYGHPSFYDTTGNTLRIKRVWQQIDTTGSAPAGFTYGTEYTTTEQILAAVTDRPNQGHGSHTAGIAAGCGAPDGNGRTYRGMAPAADIVLVGCNMEETGVVDAIRYLHEYARSVSKPLVINISLGTIIGPHDGMGAADIMVSNYLSGKDSIVVVVSAGNNGGSNYHFHHQFTSTDTVVRTFFGGSGDTEFEAVADIWGDVGDVFSASVSLHDYNPVTGVDNIVATLPFVTSAVDSVYTFNLTSPRDSVYTCEIAVVGANPNNNRPNLSVTVSKQGSGATRDRFSLEIRSAAADLHAWSSEGEFSNGGQEQYMGGDNAYTMGGAASNTDAVISVGSYATKTKSLSDDGRILNIGFDNSVEGELSYFSSHGPTWDGRVKPDICAPGQYLTAAINASYAPDYLLVCDSIIFNGQTHYYAYMQGTSMSSPSAAGVVALWMQRNPSLNVDSVRALLHGTARHDGYTGDIPSGGSNLWGWGKINAFGGMPETTVPMHQADITVSNVYQGYTTGSGRYPEGQITIAAFPVSGYDFDGWSDGVADNPRILNLVSDTSIIANFIVSSCDTISQFPWQANFSRDALLCWESFYNVGMMGWMGLQETSISSISMDGNVDSWIITPHIIPAANTALFYTTVSRTRDSLAIVIVTEADDTVVLDDILSTNTTTEHHIDLTSYAGQVIRIGFNHHYVMSVGMLTLKDVSIDYGTEGVGDVEAQTAIVATDGLRVMVSGAVEGQMNIYDAIGRCVHSAPSAQGTFLLPAPGVYVVRVGSNLPVKIVATR